MECSFSFEFFEENGGIVLYDGFYGYISNGAATIGIEDEDGNVYNYNAAFKRNIVVPFV